MKKKDNPPDVDLLFTDHPSTPPPPPPPPSLIHDKPDTTVVSVAHDEDLASSVVDSRSGVFREETDVRDQDLTTLESASEKDLGEKDLGKSVSTSLLDSGSDIFREETVSNGRSAIVEKTAVTAAQNSTSDIGSGLTSDLKAIIENPDDEAGLSDLQLKDLKFLRSVFTYAYNGNDFFEFYKPGGIKFKPKKYTKFLNELKVIEVEDGQEKVPRPLQDAFGTITGTNNQFYRTMYRLKIFQLENATTKTYHNSKFTRESPRLREIVEGGAVGGTKKAASMTSGQGGIPPPPTAAATELVGQDKATDEDTRNGGPSTLGGSSDALDGTKIAASMTSGQGSIPPPAAATELVGQDKATDEGTRNGGPSTLGGSSDALDGTKIAASMTSGQGGIPPPAATELMGQDKVTDRDSRDVDEAAKKIVNENVGPVSTSVLGCLSDASQGFDSIAAGKKILMDKLKQFEDQLQKLEENGSSSSTSSLPKEKILESFLSMKLKALSKVMSELHDIQVLEDLVMNNLS